MTKTCHFYLCVTFIITMMNVAIIDSALTYKQMQIAGTVMRETCQLDLSNELIDGIKVGKFPENNNQLECYVNCVLELMVLIRNGVPNFDFVISQMNKMLPEELREPYVNGLNACRNAAEGITDKCRVAYKLVECFYHNNPQFMFP